MFTSSVYGTYLTIHWCVNLKHRQLVQPDNRPICNPSLVAALPSYSMVSVLHATVCFFLLHLLANNNVTLKLVKNGSFVQSLFNYVSLLDILCFVHVNGTILISLSLTVLHLLWENCYQLLGQSKSDFIRIIWCIFEIFDTSLKKLLWFARIKLFS